MVETQICLSISGDHLLFCEEIRDHVCGWGKSETDNYFLPDSLVFVTQGVKALPDF